MRHDSSSCVDRREGPDASLEISREKSIYPAKTNQRSGLTQHLGRTYLLGSSKDASPESSARSGFGRSARETGAGSPLRRGPWFGEGAQPSTNQLRTSVRGSPIGRDGYAGSRQDTFRDRVGNHLVLARDDASLIVSNPERARLRPSFLGVRLFGGSHRSSHRRARIRGHPHVGVSSRRTRSGSVRPTSALPPGPSIRNNSPPISSDGVNVAASP